MLGRLRRSGSGQFAATILIFALMLQGMAFAIARLAVKDVGDSTIAAFELCRHTGFADDGGNAAVPPGAPEDPSSHCIFCLAGPSYGLDAPLPALRVHSIGFTITPWTFTALRLPTIRCDASARPRRSGPVGNTPGPIIGPCGSNTCIPAFRQSMQSAPYSTPEVEGIHFTAPRTSPFRPPARA